jgi:hypothetical protein
VASFGSRIRGWLYGAPEKERGSPPESGAGRSAAASPEAALSSYAIPNQAAFDRFGKRLQELVAKKGTLPYGQINIIGLDKLQERMGARWPKMKDKVHSAAEKIIHEHMTALDVHVRYSESDYLIVFATMSTDAARLKCAKIADDICAYFLGTPETGAISVKTAVGRVNDQLVFEDISIPNLLNDLASRADKVEATPGKPSPEPAKTPSTAGAPAPRAIKGDDADGAVAARAAVPAGPSRPGPDVPPQRPAHVENSARVAKAAGGNPTPAPYVMPPNLPTRPLEAAAVRRRPGPTAVHDDTDLWGIVDDLPSFGDAERDNALMTYVYRPVWDVANKLLSTYYCVPMRLFPGFGRRYGYAVLDDRSDSYAVARLDLETFKAGLCMLDELQRNRFQIFMAVSVQFETVATLKYREVYIEIAQRLPERMRKYLVIELVNLPDGVPQSRLSELVNSLKPFCSAVLANTALRGKTPANFIDTGLHAIGTDLRREPMPEAEAIARINQFVIEANRHRLWTFLHGVQTTSMVMAAVAAGVRYVAGDRVGPLAEVPMHIHKYKWEDFLFQPQAM